MNKKRLYGFLIAPLAGLCHFVIILLFSGLIHGLFHGFNTEPTLFVFILSVIMIGLPLFYILAVFIGIPVVIFLLKQKFLSVLSFVYAGCLIGLVLGILFDVIVNVNINLVTLSDSMILIFPASIISFLVFWFVGIRS
jgi:hypothetical protein